MNGILERQGWNGVDKIGSRADLVLDVLRTRRSVPQVREESPPRVLIEQMLMAAVWAPNHHRTRPWRFVVITGDERARLGDVFAEAACAHAAATGQPTPDSVSLERERRKPLRAPVIIAVGCDVSESPKIKNIEEIAAVAAAVENMLIAGHALGLGCMWRTGPAADAAEVKRFVGLAESAHLVAFVYVGYAADLQLPERESDISAYVTWRG